MNQAMQKFNHPRMNSCEGFIINQKSQENIYEIALCKTKIDGTRETIKIYLTCMPAECNLKNTENFKYCYEGISKQGIQSAFSLPELLNSIEEEFNQQNIDFDSASILIQNKTFYFEKNEMYKNDASNSLSKDKMIFTQKLSLFALINLLSKNEYFSIKDSCGDCLGTISHFSFNSPSISDLFFWSQLLSNTLNKMIIRVKTQNLFTDYNVNNGESWLYGDKMMKSPLDMFRFLFENTNLSKHVFAEKKNLIDKLPEINTIMSKIDERKMNEISHEDLDVLIEFNLALFTVNEKINKNVSEVDHAC